MDNREQQAFDKKQKEAGLKTEYILSKGNSSFEITKAEYDYLSWLSIHSKAETAKKPETVKEAPKRQAAGETSNKEKIEDFGEKLEGARKNRAFTLSDDLKDEDYARESFAKLWPADEHEKYEDPFVSAVAFAARAEIKAKPRVSYKLRRWVENVKNLRGLAQLIATGSRTREQLLEMIDTYALRQFANKVKVLEAIPRDQWKRIGRVEAWPDAYSYVDNKKEPRPYSSVEIDGKREVFETADMPRVIEATLGALSKEVSTDKRMAFEIRGRGGK
jgi:hypothetical protein